VKQFGREAAHLIRSKLYRNKLVELVDGRVQGRKIAYLYDVPELPE